MSVIESRCVDFNEQLDETPAVVGDAAIDHFKHLPYGNFYMTQGVKPLFYLNEHIVIAVIVEQRRAVAIDTRANIFSREHVIELFQTNGILYAEKFHHSVKRVKGFDPDHPRLVRGARIAIYNQNHRPLGDVVLGMDEE